VSTENHVVQVGEYELAGTADAYVDAIGRLADRTEREGHPGVLQYRFFVNAAAGSAGAVIVFDSADSWRAHHDVAYQWEEMGELQATVRLQRLILFGPLTEEVTSGLAGAGISYDHYPGSAAQFVRP
jgi:hypothetical protein